MRVEGTCRSMVSPLYPKKLSLLLEGIGLIDVQAPVAVLKRQTSPLAPL